MNINLLNTNKNTQRLHSRINDLQQEPNFIYTSVGAFENPLKASYKQLQSDINMLNLLDDLIMHCKYSIEDVTCIAHYLMGMRNTLPSGYIINSQIDIKKALKGLHEDYKWVFKELLKVHTWGCLGKKEHKVKTLDKLILLRKALFHTDVDSAQLETRNQSIKF